MQQKMEISPAVEFFALAIALVAMILLAPVVRSFGGLATAAGAVLSLWLRRRRLKIQSLRIDALPMPEEVDETIANYDKEMNRFWDDWKARR
jgi:hypothetical protein